MYEKAAVLFLYAETPVHPGTGGGIGIIDLPIQREAHTELPIMYGSGIKGALKDAVKIDPPRKNALFGRETEDDKEDHNSALSFTDAQLLAFPVKAANGLFAWITCAKQLALLDRALRAAEKPVTAMKLDVGETECFVPQGYTDQYIILEDQCFQRKGEHSLVDTLTDLLFTENDWFRDHFRESLIVVSDAVFGHFARKSTDVRTRVSIDNVTGVVKGTALWTEEYLPADSILFTSVLASRPTANACGIESAKAALQLFIDNKPQIAQFGGNETVGKGFMRLTTISEVS